MGDETESKKALQTLNDDRKRKQIGSTQQCLEDIPSFPFVRPIKHTSLIKKKDLTIKDLHMKYYPKQITESPKD